MTTEVGDVLFAEGQPEYDVHVVVSGSVAVYDDIDGARTLDRDHPQPGAEHPGRVRGAGRAGHGVEEHVQRI